MPMDPPAFMLASFSMFEAEYSICRVAIVYTDRLLKDQNYDEFNESCLMPPISTVVCTLSLPNFFPLVISIINGKNLHEFEADGKMAIDDGDTGQEDISSIGMKESAKLGIHSGGEPMMDTVQQSEGNSCANLVGAETEIRLL